MKTSPTIRREHCAPLPGIEPGTPGASFEAELPYGPSINHYWRHRLITPRGRRAPIITVYTSAEGKEFQLAVAALVKANGLKEPLTGPLSVTLVVYPPDAREIDVDNRIKPVADALAEAGVVKNDKQFQVWNVSLGPICRPDGRMTVKIEPRA